MTTRPSSVFLTAGTSAAHHGQSFFAGFDWADGATVIAAVSAALIAAIIAVIGYSIQRKITRRAEQATLYADAIAAVESYLEAPYRIRRKIKDPANWFAISSAISDAKTAMSHQQALLEMHAPKPVVAAYAAFSRAAIVEAGPQMTAAWAEPVVKNPRQIPLGAGNAYPRTSSDAARATLVAVMAADLKATGSWWQFWR